MKTIKKLKEEILEYEEMIDNLTPQGYTDDELVDFEKEIEYYEMIIKNNKDLIDFIRNDKN